MTKANFYSNILLFSIQTADEGAETVLYVSLSSEIESSGYYYEDCAQLKSSKVSYNKVLQNRLARLTRNQLNQAVIQFNDKYPQYKVKLIYE